MHFLRVFLLSVLPLTSAQSPEVLCLPYYEWGARSFAILDTNNNTILDKMEHSKGYFSLRGPRKNISHEYIYLDMLIARYGEFGIDSTAATALFHQYDLDKNGEVSLWDFQKMYPEYDKDGVSGVSPEEFIIYYNRMFTIAGVDARFGR